MNQCPQIKSSESLFYYSVSLFFLRDREVYQKVCNIQVRELTPQDDELLIQFLNTVSEAKPNVLAYHYPFYRDMLKKLDIGTPFYVGAFFENEMVGYLPGFMKNTALKTVFSSLPFFGPNGGVIAIDNVDRSELHHKLISFFLSTARSKTALCSSIYTPFLETDFALYDDSFENPIKIKKSTQYLVLENANWNSGLIAKNIRKALKNGVTVTQELSPRNIEQFYKIYSDNCHEYDIPLKPFECIAYLSKPNIHDNWARFYFAMQDDIVIGGLIVLSSPSTASYYIPCSLSSKRTIQANTLLINYAVQDLRKLGVRYLNFESSPSKDSGVYKFKQKWGTLESDYFIYLQVDHKEDIVKLGKDGIQKLFPYFFVYPFNLLERKTR